MVKIVNSDKLNNIFYMILNKANDEKKKAKACQLERKK